MPDNKQNTMETITPGIEPELLIMKHLFARLTVQEKLRAIADVESLLDSEA